MTIIYTISHFQLGIIRATRRGKQKKATQKGGKKNPKTNQILYSFSIIQYPMFGHFVSCLFNCFSISQAKNNGLN